jgi:hypothetical protein
MSETVCSKRTHELLHHKLNTLKPNDASSGQLAEHASMHVLQAYVNPLVSMCFVLPRNAMRCSSSPVDYTRNVITAAQKRGKKEESAFLRGH